MVFDECYHLARHGQIGSLNEIRNLPVYERRYALYKLNQEFEKQNEQIEKAKRKNSFGSFRKK